MTKEFREFLVELEIREENGKSTRIKKKEYIEIDGKHFGGKGGSGEKQIEFEKDGKKYKIHFSLAGVKKGWFRDKGGFGITRFDHHLPFKVSILSAKATEGRWQGKVLVGSGVFILSVGLVFFGYFLAKRKKAFTKNFSK